MRMTRTSIFLVAFFIFCFSGHVFASGSSIDIHGFISQGYLKTDENNYMTDTKDGSFQFNEMGINFGTWVASGLRVGMQFFARDMGDIGEDEVEIDWAFGDYRWRDWLGIRVGKLKIPLGFYNETRDMDMLRTSVLLPTSLYSETNRETINAMKGAGIYGDIYSERLGGFSYQFLAGTSDIGTDSAVAKSAEGASLSTAPMKVDDIEAGEDQYVYSIMWDTPVTGLRIGTSFLHARMDMYAHLTQSVPGPPDFSTTPPTFPVYVAGTTVHTDLESMDIRYFSTEYSIGDVVLSGECLQMNRKTRMKIFSGPMAEKDFTMDMDTDSIGYYGSISYRPFVNFSVATYYSEFFSDEDDKDGENFSPSYKAWLKDFCISLSYDVTSNWVVKIEGHHMDGVAFLFPQDNIGDSGVPEYEKEWYLFAAKVTFVF